MTQPTHYEWLLQVVLTADRRAAPYDYRRPASFERRHWNFKAELERGGTPARVAALTS